MPARSLLATTAVSLAICGGLVAADAASATVLMQASKVGTSRVSIDKRITVPGWKIRRAKRVIAVMVGRTTELDPSGVQVDGVPSEMEGIVKVVCTGFRGGIAQRTIHFAAEGDGQNASIIRLPGYTGYGCAFRFAVLAQWFPSANTLVNQFAAVRIETY